MPGPNISQKNTVSRRLVLFYSSVISFSVVADQCIFCVGGHALTVYMNKQK